MADPDRDPNDEADSDEQPIEGELVEPIGQPPQDEGPPEPPLFVQALMGAGLVSDDLLVAEVAATGGPQYDLSELPTEAVVSLCDRLDGAGVQWAIDRAGQLVVHVNDERRADAAVEDVFGPDDHDGPIDDETEHLRRELEAQARQLAHSPVSEGGRGRWLGALAVLAVVVVLLLVLT